MNKRETKNNYNVHSITQIQIDCVEFWPKWTAILNSRGAVHIFYIVYVPYYLLQNDHQLNVTY